MFNLCPKKSNSHLIALFIPSVMVMSLTFSGCASHSYETSTAQSTESTASAEASTNSDHSIGEYFTVGYTSYSVDKIQWRKRLGDAYFGANANARYLLVSIQVKNDDTKSRMIPPFGLVDENGATYEESSDRMYLGDKAVLLDSLNPGVQKKAVLVFDVPTDKHYKLKVDGGYWSSEDALVKLN